MAANDLQTEKDEFVRQHQRPSESPFPLQFAPENLHTRAVYRGDFVTKMSCAIDIAGTDRKIVVYT